MQVTNITHLATTRVFIPINQKLALDINFSIDLKYKDQLKITDSKVRIENNSFIIVGDNSFDGYKGFYLGTKLNYKVSKNILIHFGIDRKFRAYFNSHLGMIQKYYNFMGTEIEKEDGLNNKMFSMNAGLALYFNR